MKNHARTILLYLIAILLLSVFFFIPCKGQDTRGIVFETIEAHLYKPSNMKEIPKLYDEGEFLLEIGEKAIKTSGFGRFEYFIYTSEWEDVVIGNNGRQKAIEVYFKDPGGAIGFINMWYSKKLDEYVLAIAYETEDQIMVYHMKPTEKKLYTHPDERPEHVPFDRDYTQEEIDEFWELFGSMIWLDFASLDWL